MGGSTIVEAWKQRIQMLKSQERQVISSEPEEDFTASSRLMYRPLYMSIQSENTSRRFLSVLEDLCKSVHVSDIVKQQVTRGGNTILHLAATYEREVILQVMADQFPQLMIETNATGDTALHLAAAKIGQKSLVAVILRCNQIHFRQNQNINLLRMKNKLGNTPLHEAVIARNLEAAAELFEADEEVANHLNEEGKSPLYLAVETKQHQLVDQLLGVAVSKNREQHQGNSPLHAAIMAMTSDRKVIHSHISLLEGWEDQARLVSAGVPSAKLDRINRKSESVRTNPEPQLEILVTNSFRTKSEPIPKSDRTDSMLQQEIFRTKSEPIPKFIRTDSMTQPVRFRTNSELEPESVGIIPEPESVGTNSKLEPEPVGIIPEPESVGTKSKSKPESVGTKSKSKPESVRTNSMPFVSSLENMLGRLHQLAYLRDQKGRMPLHFAASMGYLKGVRTILDKISFSALLECDDKGYLPIHIACKKGYVDVVEFLWRRGRREFEPVDLLNKKGQNLLHIAAKNGKETVVKHVLNEEMLEKLLNQRDNNGNTPLHLASKYMHPKILYLLTQDKRIKVNLLNNKGMTARDIVVLRRSTPSTLREFLSFAILKYAGTPLTEKGRRIRHLQAVPPQVEWIRDRVSIMLLVAILIATVTFAAGFTVPGGVNTSEDKDREKIGMPTLLNSKMFQVFTFCGAIAMYSSTMASSFLLCAHLREFHIASTATYFAFYLIVLALVTMSVAFMAALFLAVRNVSWLAYFVIAFGAIFLLMFLGLFILLIFPLGKRGFFLGYISDFILKVVIALSGSDGKLRKVKVKETKVLEETKKEEDKVEVQQIVRQLSLERTTKETTKELVRQHSVQLY